MGLQILFPSGEDAEDIDLNMGLNLDIVAIHGLNGNPLNTWTEPKSQKLWLRDFLPHDVPNARIMTFGYDATAAFENTTAGILEHARDLLRCLEEARTEDEERERPLLFVAHSLGGLVLKQALVIAAEGNHTQYVPVWKAMAGICFFGTPHRGSSLATYGVQLARIPSSLSMKPSPKLLESLSAGSAVLGELNDKFRQLMSSRGVGEGKAVVSFYETISIVGWVGLVVKHPSALINPVGEPATWETPIPANAHHRDMCRFSSSKNPIYKSAVHNIQRLRGLESEEALVENEHFLVPHALNMQFTGRDDIRKLVKIGLLRDDYAVQREQSRFVLYGMGGSGKTQLCLKFAQDFKKKFWAVFFIDASSQTNASNGFASIAKALNIAISSPELIINNVKNHLQTKSNWLLIIDNADDPQLDLWQFLPQGKDSSILITTRNPEAVKYANAGSFCVERMNEKDAIKLLLRTSGLEEQSVRGGDQTQETEPAREIVETLGFLALAIIQAGAVIRQRLVSLNGFCALYSTRRKELLESGKPDATNEYQRSVYTTWEISIHTIEAMNEKHAVFALELLRHFSFMHFDGIMEETFENARKVGVPGDRTFFASTMLVEMMPLGWDQLLMGRALSLLLSLSLISMDPNRRISMHPLVHQWSRERMGEEEKKNAWFVTFYTLAMGIGWTPGVEIYQRYGRAMPHIDACIYGAIGSIWECDALVNERVRAAVCFAGVYREVARINDSMNLINGVLKILDTFYPIGQWCFIEAMRIFATNLEVLGRYDEAASNYQKMLDVQRNGSADASAIIRTITGKALNYENAEKYEESINLCESAILEFQHILKADSIPMLELAETVAYSKMRSGKLSEAQVILEKSMGIRTILHGENWGGESLLFLGRLVEVYWGLRQWKKAIALQKSLIKIVAERHGENHVYTVGARARLWQIMFESGSIRIAKRAKDIALLEETYKAARGNQGEMSLFTLTCMRSLAQAYFACGALEKGKRLQQEIILITTEKWGSEHGDTVEAVKALKRMQRWILMRNIAYWWIPKRIMEDIFAAKFSSWVKDCE